MRPTGPVTAEINGREVVLACSNDYLGLGAQRIEGRSGACSSRLINGSHPSHRALEDELEAWLGRPCLVFPSGYQANVAVFSTVCAADQHIASDVLNHASIIDGLRLSPARRTVVPHADPTAIPTDADLVVVESLYSMDGDLAPIADYPTAPWLAVDEAHAIGCLGPAGRGVAATTSRTPDLVIGTFGKAFGASGAFVCGPPELKQLLVNAGRSFIYTTAAPPALIDGIRRSLVTVRRADHLRDRLATNAACLRRSLVDLGWNVLGDAHILPVLTGADTLSTADRLFQAGVFAPGIRYPTVARGQERVRLTVSAAHTPAQLDQIAEAFGPR